MNFNRTVALRVVTNFFDNVAPSLVVWHRDIRGSLQLAECVLVVDCGFSFTHVTPVVNGRVIWSAVKRYPLCGRLM
jgi:actin-related protein 6